MSVTTTRPIDTITLSQVPVNGIGVTIEDITIAYINTAARCARLSCGGIGTIDTSRLTAGAVVEAESFVLRFVRSARVYIDSSLFANMMGAEIGEMLFMERNGYASESAERFGERGDTVATLALEEGPMVLVERPSGDVDWDVI